MAIFAKSIRRPGLLARLDVLADQSKPIPKHPPARIVGDLQNRLGGLLVKALAVLAQ
jgi:hypothetical protein